MDIVLVIDNSGSMGGVKIKLLKNTHIYIIEELKETDRLALIVFN